MQYSILLNSTTLDGVGLRGQTNATCCAVRTRIVEIRNLGRIMIPNSQERGDLLRKHECNNVKVRGQTGATFLFTHENKTNIERCCIKCLMEIKLC